jgi:hypothetical protein
MCKKLVCVLSLVLVLGFSSIVQGTTYYVSPSGNDNDAGTSPSTAWATTDKVNSTTFSPGDSILFEGGETFSGGLVFTESGTAANPIIIGSYGSGRATIQGDFEEIVLYALNCAGYEISDMIFRGSGNTGNQDNLDFCGIKFYNTSGVELEYVRAPTQLFEAAFPCHHATSVQWLAGVGRVRLLLKIRCRNGNETGL